MGQPAGRTERIIDGVLRGLSIVFPKRGHEPDRGSLAVTIGRLSVQSACDCRVAFLIDAHPHFARHDVERVVWIEPLSIRATRLSDFVLVFAHSGL